MQNFLLLLPVLLFSMVAHEYAHGYAALKQGDSTALLAGRLTLNPIKHIDPWMTLIVPAILYYSAGILFGGAKPVPVDPRNFREYRRGDIIVSAAGVFVNFCLAIAFLLASLVIGVVGSALGGGHGILGLLQWMALMGIWINLILVIFNLVPVPPLDGSHILYHLLPTALAARYRALSQYGILFVVLLILVPGAIAFLLAPARWLFSIALAVARPWVLSGFPGGLT